MGFLIKIKGWVYAIVAGFLAIITVFFCGKAIGKTEQEITQTKEVLNDVKKAKKVSASAISRDAATKLSKRYSRK